MPFLTLVRISEQHPNVFADSAVVVNSSFWTVDFSFLKFAFSCRKPNIWPNTKNPLFDAALRHMWDVWCAIVLCLFITLNCATTVSGFSVCIKFWTLRKCCLDYLSSHSCTSQLRSALVFLWCYLHTTTDISVLKSWFLSPSQGSHHAPSPFILLMCLYDTL